MPDIKGFNTRAAQLRPGQGPAYGLVLRDIQAHIAEWIADYGPDGILTIAWQRQESGHHAPTLVPAFPPVAQET